MKIFEITDRSERFPKSLRKALKKQQDNKCAVCGNPGEQPGSRHSAGLEVHHVIPRSQGGQSNIDNSQLVCRPCHVKIHQLDEAISLTHLKPDLTQLVKSAIRKCFKVVLRRNLNNNNEIIDAITNSITNSLELNIADLLWNNQQKYGAYVTFDNLSYHGIAKRNSIVLSHTLIDNLANKILQKVESTLLYDNNKDLNKIADDPFVQQHINHLTDTIIHELVHIKQHSKQPKDKPTEYRSYLTKNKEQFYNAVKNLESQQDWKLYLASPQEIPAHAHNFALELINFLWDQPVDNINDKDIANKLIINIDDVFKWQNVIQGMQRHKMYQQFKTPGTTEYKVFKKFMTAAYKELQNFKNQVQIRANQIP